jgi:23S rRNA G2069 N7-methylase RlmK/C1962 C5-methylase RlmI
LPQELGEAQKQREFSEIGVRYLVQARHGGQDPWLFLDMRAGRRRIMQEVAGKTLLNLFAYTCGIGVAAAKAGAAYVVNVDFAESNINVGKENARLNCPASASRKWCAANTCRFFPSSKNTALTSSFSTRRVTRKARLASSIRSMTMRH